MSKLLFVLSVLGIFVLGTAVHADDAPVYAVVSSVKELRAAVSNLKPATGGAIYLKPGTYVLEDPVVIQSMSNVSILGAGMDKTILKTKGSGSAIVFSGPCNFCSVRNIRIIGDSSARTGSGVLFRDTDWSGLSMIDSCEIVNFADSGVYFAGRFATPQSSTTVSNCILKNNRRAQIYNDHCNDYSFLGNHMIVDNPAAAGACGIFLAAGAGNIGHNYFKGCRIGVRLDKATTMNRLEYNFFDDCKESAFDSGVDVPADYDVTKAPHEQLYTAWEWDNPKAIKMNSENMFCWNTIYSSGKNPDFAALVARNTTFTTFFGNIITLDRKIKNIVRANDRNCMTWILSHNTISGSVDHPYLLPQQRNMCMSENTTKPRGSVGIKRPAYEMSALSRKLLKVAEGSDPSGKSWYRKVTSTDELAKAIRDVPASGGTIYIVSGKYLVNNPLTIENKSNVTIIGAGLSAFLRGLNDGDLLAFKGRCLNCYVGNITVTPDKADPWHPVDQKSGSGIHFQGEGENFAVEYCAANNFPESCIKIEGKPDNPVRHANVSYCWGMCGKQAELSLIRCKGLRAYGNQWGSSFPNRPAVGAYFEYCSDGLYDFNYHWNNRHGIQLYQGCEDIKLTCNRAEQSQESGVVLGVKTGGGKPNRNLTMMGNTFHTNPELKPGDPGICADMLVRDTSDVKFIANQLYTWWDPRKFTHGVELDDASRNWLFDGNYIRDNTESAVKYNPAGGHIFKLNYFEPR